MNKHLVLALAAFFVSEPAYSLWYEFAHHWNPWFRRLALRGKTRALVLHDRVLNERLQWSGEKVQ